MKRRNFLKLIPAVAVAPVALAAGVEPSQAKDEPVQFAYVGDEMLVYDGSEWTTPGHTEDAMRYFNANVVVGGCGGGGSGGCGGIGGGGKFITL